MQILRFRGNDQRVYTGCDFQDGSASVIEGSIFKDFINTKRRRKVISFLPPLEPAAIICIGLNYKMHAEETGAKLPEYPVMFMKNPGAMAAHNQDILLPPSCIDPPQVDYEAELAVIIGRKIKNVTPENALDAVFGYACANDVSARRWQKHSGAGQWVRGKSFDTFCPFGPWMVTADEIKDPQTLGVQCILNGEIMQSGHTSDMIFTVAEVISFLSRSTTLLPGTIILTGTPSGVGFARNPPVYLKSGDVVEIKVDQIGVLKNRVRNEGE